MCLPLLILAKTSGENEAAAARRTTQKELVKLFECCGFCICGFYNKLSRYWRKYTDTMEMTSEINCLYCSVDKAIENNKDFVLETDITLELFSK